MRGWMTATAALLLAACAGTGGGESGPADTVRASSAARDTPRVSVDGVRPADTRPWIPAPAASDTGYTPWSAVELPSEPWMQRAADPRALLARVRDVVAAQLEEPDAGVLRASLQAESADSAVALLVHPDLADDSVRDIEFRLHLRREGAEWAVAGVDRRDRCRRGVTPGGLCA